MSGLLIAVIILLYTLQSLFCRLYTEHYPSDKKIAPSVFAIVCGITVGVVSFACSGFAFQFSGKTVIFGAINAVVLYLYDTFIAKASESGSYSVLMVFNLSGGIIIPCLVATFAFGDYLGPVKLICILTIFAAIYMVSHKPKDVADKNSRVTFSFIIICLLLGVSNGLYGMLLDLQSRTTGINEKEEMVAITFVGAALISLVHLSVSQKKHTAKAFRQTKRSLAYLLLCSFVSAAAINLLVYILPIVNVTLLYTFDNAGVMVLSALASRIFFKEKLTRLNVVGCLVMCACLICMSLSSHIESLFT